MKFLAWRDKPWQKRALLVLTAVLLVLLAAHPELRLLVPVLDLLGIDLFVLLAASPVLDALRPTLDAAWRVLQPLGGQIFFYLIFFFGLAGWLRGPTARGRAGAGCA